MYIFITLVLITLTLKISIFSDIPSFLYFPLHVSVSLSHHQVEISGEPLKLQLYASVILEELLQKCR
jgi:hypothetical protein